MSELKGREERELAVASVLLKSRIGAENWGPIATETAQACTKKSANQFLLCCLLDYQIKSAVAWQNGVRLIQHFGDPEDIWAVICTHSREEWADKFKELHLHRFPAAHSRLWKIGKEICARYEGDARKIWQGRDAIEAREKLWILGAGEQISKMIVGALRDIRHIEGTGDVKADVHVCRVLGRIYYGNPVEPNLATEIARRIHASDPWQLDWPLWTIGTSHCHPTSPHCMNCEAETCCTYAQAQTLRG